MNNSCSYHNMIWNSFLTFTALLGLPYLFEYKSHSSIRRTKLGPEFGTKFFHNNLKGTLEMLEDTHTDHKLSSLTVVRTMFMHDSPYFTFMV